MGTRADFYKGRGANAEWIASIAWDGYPDGIPDNVKSAKTEEDYAAALSAFLSKRDDVSRPDDGWPWPWESSHTTDFAYAFDSGQVFAACFGSGWLPADAIPDETDYDDEGVWEKAGTVEFPNMKHRQQVTMGKRSGLIVFSAPNGDIDSGRRR